MNDRTLITTGLVGGALAALCCATPLLAVVLGAAGLTAWLSKADYLLIAALLICLGLVGIGLCRRRAAVEARCDQTSPKQGSKSRARLPALDSWFPTQCHSVAAWPWGWWRRCVAAADCSLGPSDWELSTARWEYLGIFRRRWRAEPS
jgi:mercuric ion transport protein